MLICNIFLISVTTKNKHIADAGKKVATANTVRHVDIQHTRLANYNLEFINACRDKNKPKLECIGKFQIFHYCLEHYLHICGGGLGITKSGTIATAFRTISVDTSVIPLGSIVVINGKEYIAEDTGNSIKGKRIDIAVETHQQALELGTYTAEVYIKETRK